MSACEGHACCTAPLHIHGCYADIDGSRCDDPEDHRSLTDNTDLIARGHDLRMDSEKGTPVERIRMLGTLANALTASDGKLRCTSRVHVEGAPMHLHSGTVRTCAQCKGSWPCPTMRALTGPWEPTPRGTGS